MPAKKLEKQENVKPKVSRRNKNQEKQTKTETKKQWKISIK